MSGAQALAPLEVIHADGLAILRLHRAAVGNALSSELVDALHGALDALLPDSSIHTLVLTGSGRHFCTGFDLGGLDATNDAELLARLVAIEQLLDRLWRAPVRTAVIAQGRCWGAGADLVAVCDERLIGADASFRFPGAGFGIVLGSRRLALRIGLDRSRRLITQGEQLDARSALQAGLASAVLEADDLPVEPPGQTASPHAVSDATIARWQRLLGAPPAIDRETLGRIRQASLRALEGDGASASDHDLAALVRSAARPGLQARIRAYRDRVQATRIRT